MSIPILSFIIWLPIVSLLFICLLPSRLIKLYRSITLITTCLQAIGILQVIKYYTAEKASPTDFKLIEAFTWLKLPLGNLGTLQIQYLIGVDGLNIGLLAMSVGVLIIATLASWHITSHSKAYFSLLLLLNTLIMGSLLALDAWLFYMLFELSLLPIYFLIGIWGGKKRIQAATHFFLYTFLGTIFLLAVMIALTFSAYDPLATGLQAGILQAHEIITPEKLAIIQEQVHSHHIPLNAIVHTLDIRLLSTPDHWLPHAMFALAPIHFLGNYPIRLIAFIVLLIGFLIKLAIVPLHSWLPQAHVEAPTPVSMILSAILLKVGGYGLVRIAYSIFPDAAWYYSPWIGILGVVSIIYAAFNALAMQDLKRMVAYASIAHMGFFLLGLATSNVEGMQGAFYQLISHGLMTTLLFLVVGILDDRTQNRAIENYSGLAQIMPRYATLGMIIFIAAMGLPGFSPFIAELLILLGAFQSSTLSPWLGILGIMGIFLNATYFIWTIQRLFWGPFSLRFPHWQSALKDLKQREYGMILPVLIAILILGIFPNLLLHVSQATIQQLVTTMQDAGKNFMELLLNP